MEVTAIRIRHIALVTVAFVLLCQPATSEIEQLPTPQEEPQPPLDAPSRRHNRQ